MYSCPARIFQNKVQRKCCLKVNWSSALRSGSYLQLLNECHSQLQYRLLSYWIWVQYPISYQVFGLYQLLREICGSLAAKSPLLYNLAANCVLCLMLSRSVEHFSWKWLPPLNQTSKDTGRKTNTISWKTLNAEETCRIWWLFSTEPFYNTHSVVISLIVNLEILIKAAFSSVWFTFADLF